MTDEINKLITELNADDIKCGKDYNGYKVFEPVYNKKCIIGFPYVIFVKNNEARICTAEESLEYLDFVNKQIDK